MVDWQYDGVLTRLLYIDTKLYIQHKTLNYFHFRCASFIMVVRTIPITLIDFFSCSLIRSLELDFFKEFFFTWKPTIDYVCVIICLWLFLRTCILFNKSPYQPRPLTNFSSSIFPNCCCNKLKATKTPSWICLGIKLDIGMVRLHLGIWRQVFYSTKTPTDALNY